MKHEYKREETENRKRQTANIKRQIWAWMDNNHIRIEELAIKSGCRRNTVWRWLSFDKPVQSPSPARKRIEQVGLRRIGVPKELRGYFEY